MTRCRQRVQQETLEHRVWKGDPLYDIRRLLLLGYERVDTRGCGCGCAALDAGDPLDHVTDAWVAKEKVREIYATDDPGEGPATVLHRDSGSSDLSGVG